MSRLFKGKPAQIYYFKDPFMQRRLTTADFDSDIEVRNKNFGD